MKACKAFVSIHNNGITMIINIIISSVLFIMILAYKGNSKTCKGWQRLCKLYRPFMIIYHWLIISWFTMMKAYEGFPSLYKAYQGLQSPYKQYNII